MSEDAANAKIGIVTIGRNEGQRLRRCLESVQGRAERIVYVDSGSTDGSVALARSLGIDVVELDMSVPFTMARGRNAGYRHVLSVDPDTDFVQFIDGDCEVVDGWLDAAKQVLVDQSDIAIVSGRRRERFPQASIYNRLCDMEWDTPIGRATTCHGDAMMRVAALGEAGLFNPELICGEESDLCLRLGRCDWSILRIDAEMTLHDAAMSRFGQWWKRMVRCGWAYAEGAAMHGRAPERHRVRQTRSVWFWGLALPVVAVVAAWFTAGWSLLGLLGYPLLAAKVYHHHQARRRRGDPPRHAALYACFCTLAKFPQVVGQLRYWRNRVLGKPARLIEYKTPASSVKRIG